MGFSSRGDCFLYFLQLFLSLKNLLIFREEGREGEGEGEKHRHERETLIVPSGDGTHNPGMCPDQESNWRPFTLWEGAQPTELLWLGGSTAISNL